MATYTRKVFATDSFSEDQTTGKRTVAPILKANTRYDFQYNQSGYMGLEPKDEVTVWILGVPAPAIDKKRLVDKKLFVYVVSCAGSLVGSRPTGSEPVFGLYPHRSFTGDYGTSWEQNYQNFKKLKNGAYNEFEINLIGLFVGTTAQWYNNVHYTSSNSLAVHSHTGANPPYRLFYYEDVIPYASNCFPSKFMDKKVENKFAWDFDYADKMNVFGSLKQSSAKFRYRPTGQTAYTEIAIAGGRNYYVMPANTITATNFEWQVIVKSDDNIESTTAEWIKVTTVDSKPSCQIISPNDTFLDGSQPNTFEWVHSVDTGSPQLKFTLQYSQNGTTWVTLCEGITPVESYTAPPNTLPAGALKWRVRTYNTDGVASVWSNIGTFVARSAPPTPVIISVDNKARPTIKWSVVGQEAYHVKIKNENEIIVDSGVVGSKVTSYQSPIYLQDGKYMLELYVVNTYDLKSNVASGEIFVVTEKPNPISVRNELLDFGVKFRLSIPSNIKKMYVLRDGQPIKKLTTETEWIDYSISGVAVYNFRGVDENDNFNDTEDIYVNLHLKSDVIAPIKDLSYLLPLRLKQGSEITQDGTVDLPVSMYRFAGRAYPVAVFSDEQNHSKPLQYTFRNIDDFKTFEAIIKLRCAVLYRTTKGDSYYGVITAYDYTRDKHTINVSCNLVVTDTVKTIRYD